MTRQQSIAGWIQKICQLPSFEERYVESRKFIYGIYILPRQSFNSDGEYNAYQELAESTVGSLARQVDVPQCLEEISQYYAANEEAITRERARRRMMRQKDVIRQPVAPKTTYEFDSTVQLQMPEAVPFVSGGEMIFRQAEWAALTGLTPNAFLGWSPAAVAERRQKEFISAVGRRCSA